MYAVEFRQMCLAKRSTVLNILMNTANRSLEKQQTVFIPAMVLLVASTRV